ncbi:uncharacterized protein FTOL_09389 [Fusarium torulosum]|uniref:Uncharacterized protein n=1 Tax=Fusarium torulosum TaxID=33205 RepID=A0AAE8MFV4_9HYPO|nr:uncharacterized protein FTOL_09389 [Fusarium torulosum]
MDFPEERGRLGPDQPEPRPELQPGQQLVLPPGPRPLPTPPESREPSQESSIASKSKRKQRDGERMARYNGQKTADRRAKQAERRLAANPLGWVPVENWDNPKVHLRQWAGFLGDSNEDTHSEDDELPKVRSLSKSKFVDAEFYEDG